MALFFFNLLAPVISLSATTPLPCQPASVQPNWPTYHIVNNVTAHPGGKPSMRALNDANGEGSTARFSLLLLFVRFIIYCNILIYHPLVSAICSDFPVQGGLPRHESSRGRHMDSCRFHRPCSCALRMIFSFC